MAKHQPSTTILFSLLLLLLLHHHQTLTTATTEQELDAAIAALTTNGYNLFGNAIATSDLRYQLLAGTNFTFFSPSDSDLFSLDMTTDASDYVQNLRYHVAIHRLSISDLNNLPPLYFINTMIPHHCLLISNNNQITASRNGIFNGSFAVDGVPVSVPDLFTGSSIVIHGLNGILALRNPEKRMNSAFDDIDLGSLSPSFRINNCFSSFSASKTPEFVTPVSSPDSFPPVTSPSPSPFSVPANSPAPVPESASSPDSFNSPAPVPESASLPDSFNSPAPVPESASSPDSFNSPAPVPVPESASSPDSFDSAAPFSVWETSPSPYWASYPATVSTSKENAEESSFKKKKREKQQERSLRRKKIERKKAQDRRRHIHLEEHDEEIPVISFFE